MTLLYTDEVNIKTPFDREELARRTVLAALETEAFPGDCEVSLTLVDGEAIRSVNQSCRGIDSVTDVLSFPLMDYEEVGGGYESVIPGTEERNPETDELLLGDIVLNMERVVSQADEYQHSLEREYAFLIAHSMLHLMGYDHMEPDDETSMRERQREIMERLGVAKD